MPAYVMFETSLRRKHVRNEGRGAREGGRPGSVVHGLDPDTVLAVGDDRCRERDVLNVVLGPAADRADAEPVSAIAVQPRDVEVRARVDRDTVILAFWS
jgi:hypothetical protein